MPLKDRFGAPTTLGGTIPSGSSTSRRMPRHVPIPISFGRAGVENEAVYIFAADHVVVAVHKRVVPALVFTDVWAKYGPRLLHKVSYSVSFGFRGCVLFKARLPPSRAVSLVAGGEVVFA